MNRTSNGFPKQFGSNGCQVMNENDEKCGETQTLEIINEFKQLYENKLKELDGGNNSVPSLQAKIDLQQEWIKDLTEQNEMLVRAVEELEMEATDRVAMLEEKLRNSAQYGCEVMQKYRDYNFSIDLDETFQKVGNLQRDVNSLIEFIRRVRDENSWNADGLQFYNVNRSDLFGSSVSSTEGCTCLAKPKPNESKDDKMQLKLQEKEAQVNELEKKISRMVSQKDFEESQTKLNQKNDEMNTLKRSMLDMRNALTIEVAEKHDVILSLRRDIQQLEEQCRQANKQTQFKDENIKELRKELKTLKAVQEYETTQTGLNEINRSLIDEITKLKLQVLREAPEMYRRLSLSGNESSLNALDKQIEDIKQIIDDDCSLFFTLVKEINNLLCNLHKKDREIVNQSELIEFLIERITFFHAQLKEMKVLTMRYKVQQEEECCEGLQKRMHDLQRDNHELKDRIAQTQANLDDAQKQLNNHQNELKSKDRSMAALGKELKTKEEALEKRQNELDEMKRSCKCRIVICDQGVMAVLSTESVALSESERSISSDDKHTHECNCVSTLQGELNRAISERGKKNQEVSNLRQTITELEKALQNMQVRADSLQKAVDLYQNSVNVLEASEEKCRLELTQQRTTIANLQEALVVAKQQLSEVQTKAAAEVSSNSWTSRWFGVPFKSNAANNSDNNNDKTVQDV